MEEISLTDAGVQDACLDAFQSFPVVMIQFPEVFGLMAMPNLDGVKGLNRTKQRLPEKYYGSVVGNAANFFGMASELPDYLSIEKAETLLENSIVRIRIADQDKHSSACFGGTHQSLLLPAGNVRSLFASLEDAFRHLSDSELFLGKSYSAPLCTSANLSGHPDGSITALNVAREFGKRAGIPLLITNAQSAVAKGSYPVLYLKDQHISIEREGPGLQNIIGRFSEGTFIPKRK